MSNHHIFRATIASTTGGILAGILLGIIESIALDLLGEGSMDLAALLWAIAAYGVIGFLAGLVLGLLAALIFGRWLPKNYRWWLAASWAAIFCAAGFIVIRFRILRDLLQQRESLFSPTGLLVNLALLGFFAVIFIIALLYARRWAKPASRGPESPGESDRDEVDLGRRDFLKFAFAGSLAMIPVAYAGSRWLQARKAPALTTHHRTGLPVNLQGMPNVILIVVDTLRADHLGSYGNPHVATPNLDAFAAQSIQFNKMFAQASWTKPSFATIFTSLYPSSHSTVYKNSILPSEAVTLAEVLATGGYIRGGFANNVNIAPLFNFGQGFSHYEFLRPDYLYGTNEAGSQTALYQTARLVNERFLQSRKVVHNFYQPAEVVNEAARNWLKANLEERFFLFLHYMEPHDPYFEHPYNNYGIARVSTPNPPAEMAPEMLRLYRGEIGYLDTRLGELFSWLKSQELYDDSLILVTGDHGEEFYEHGGWWHGLTLYEEQIHVPLFMKLPGNQRAGELDTHFARLMDIGPTIIRQAGLEIPSSMQGVDLMDTGSRTQLVFAEGDHEGNILQAIRGETWKLIEANKGNPRGLPPTSLFNLLEDPGEFLNLAEKNPAKLAELTGTLNQVSTLALSQAISGTATELDPETIEQLRSLGY